MTFKEFIARDRPLDVWIEEPDLSCYMRKSNRHLGDDVYACLDVASVKVAEERRGQGVFRAFLLTIEGEAKRLRRAVFVESLLEPRLVNFLLKMGYTIDSRTVNTPAPSFFKVFWNTDKKT